MRNLLIATGHETLSQKLVRMPEVIRKKERDVTLMKGYRDTRDTIEGELRERIRHLYKDVDQFVMRAEIFKKMNDSLERISSNDGIDAIKEVVSRCARSSLSPEEQAQFVRIERAIPDYCANAIAMGRAYETLEAWKQSPDSATETDEIREAKAVMDQYNKGARQIFNVVDEVRKEEEAAAALRREAYNQRYSEAYRFFLPFVETPRPASYIEQIHQRKVEQFFRREREAYEAATPQLRGVH